MIIYYEKNYPKSFRAFTLIELIIAITIFFAIVMISYIPYSYYQNKAKLKLSTREISQAIYIARNMATNGLSSGSNLSVGLYLDSSLDEKNTIKFLSYPHSFTGAQITNTLSPNIKLLKTLVLQPGIEINSIYWEESGSSISSLKALFFFESIKGNGKYYYWDSSDIKRPINSDEINIEFSYKNSSGLSLRKTIKYYTKTNIVDY